jgi:hypothetical protein
LGAGRRLSLAKEGLLSKQRLLIAEFIAWHHPKHYKILHGYFLVICCLITAATAALCTAWIFWAILAAVGKALSLNEMCAILTFHLHLQSCANNKKEI